MPSPYPPSSKRERLARFVSRLRSNQTAGSPLLVQTGFPTSLADLVVKNRSKLFRKRKKIPQLENIVPTEEVGDDGGGLVVESPNVIGEDVEALGVEKRAGGLGFWGLKVAALVVLAVGGRWVVVGITILAFGLVGLDIFGGLKPRAKENVVDITNMDCLEIVRGAFNLRGRELVSPIREIEPSSCRSDSTGDITMGRRDFDVVDYGGKDRNTGNSHKPKRKKLLRKLFRRKNSKKRDVEESNLSLDKRTSSHEEVPTGSQETSDGPTGSQETSDGEYFSFEETDEVTRIKTGDVERIRDTWGDFGLGKWRNIAFFDVIILGLLGGKGSALVLAVACYLLSVCTGTVWKKWKMR